MSKRLNLLGERFGKLLVVEDAGKDHANFTLWKCLCDCGKYTVVRTNALRMEQTRSCGCGMANKQNTDRVLVDGKMVRPDGFNCWRSMQSRCYCESDDNYKKYGAKGITVCDRWLGPGGLANFLADMGPRPSKRHSVGRRDPWKGYEPSNCEWQTPLEQGKFKKNSRMLTHNGVTKHFAQWERDLGLADGSLHLRLARGWSIEKALSTPRVGGLRPLRILTEEAGRMNQGATINDSYSDMLTG